MKEIAWTDLKKLPHKEVEALLPIQITYNGFDSFQLSDPKDTLCVADFHPTIVNRIRQLWNRGKSYAEAVSPKEKVYGAAIRTR